MLDGFGRCDRSVHYYKVGSSLEVVCQVHNYIQQYTTVLNCRQPYTKVLNCCVCALYYLIFLKISFCCCWCCCWSCWSCWNCCWAWSWLFSWCCWSCLVVDVVDAFGAVDVVDVVDFVVAVNYLVNVVDIVVDWDVDLVRQLEEPGEPGGVRGVGEERGQGPL